MIKVDEKKCIGCGACEAQCPENFHMVDKNGKYVAKVKNSSSKAPCNKEAADSCPVDAIKV